MNLTKQEIETGLLEIGLYARNKGKIVDIAIFGGSVITLAWEFRVSTKDVGAVVMNAADKTLVNDAVQSIAKEYGWDQDWLNDAIKGFISDHATFNQYHFAEESGIRVYVPTPEYMLAMKCMAMRTESPEETKDVTDIKCLVKMLGITDTNDVLEIVERYYPRKQILPNTLFGIEEIMERLANDKQ